MNDCTIVEARRRWQAAQSLDRACAGSLEDAIAATGWLRTLGGATAYLSLRARVRDFSVDALHAAVAEERLLVMPSARGCIYLVPRAHAPLALHLARHLTRSRVERDMDKAGMEPGEWETVASAVTRVLSNAPATTAELRRLLGDSAIRSLGAPGKKVGLTSTLPPTLRMMEFAGAILRVPADHRLDHEKYTWKLADDPALTRAPDGDFRGDLARLFFRWAGPANLEEFASWSGLNKTDSRAGIAAAELAECTVDGEGPWYAPTNTPAPAADAPIAWLGAMDNFVSLRSSGALVADPAHHDIPVSNFGYDAIRPLASMNQPIERLLVWGGRVVGMWAWHPERNEPICHFFEDLPSAARSRMDDDARQVAQVFASLGHAKTFSLDKDEKVLARAERILALSQS